MLTFMEYIQRAFDHASDWNRDNSYSTLTLTAQSLLDFPTPLGLRLHISSLPTPNLGTSYTLSTTGLVSGSLSYLYSSLPLRVPASTPKVDLRDFITGYRHLSTPVAPDQEQYWELWHQGRRVDTRDVLLYGRVFLPRNRLEALYLRRTKPSQLVQVRAVSDATLPNGGTVLGMVQNDHGRYSTEYLYSTDSALLGIRGLYNFGTDPPNSTPSDNQAGLFSLGSELYYGVLNKSFGLSTGLRFTTLPSYGGFPYTMTLTLNPLMGNLSSTYSVKAGKNLALSSRFDFNFYSYESGVLVGLELWRRRRPQILDPDLEWARRKMAEGEDVPPTALLVSKAGGDTAPMAGRTTYSPSLPSSPKAAKDSEDVTGILKLRIDQSHRIGLLWEGRFKELLFSVGANVDLRKREQIFRGIGLEVGYSS